ncbi:TPA: MoxR family ATPase [Candidatus Poribacteria bacterium]|nr:MoxR family ATPase [Candidatus Poribacteria bacterium]
MQHHDISELNRRIAEQSSFIEDIKREVAKVIIGQKYLIDRLLIGLLANGHVLLEGVPGLAKTTAVKALSDAIQTKFQRLQFTPDLLPADIIGTMIYNQKENIFTPKKGPIFANLILADEINRAPAKVQSALLEAMQERQVTIGDETYPLEELFLVFATQNPIEQEGTYQLPEAQVDRFMLKLKIDYPRREEEIEILRRMTQKDIPKVQKVVSPEEIIKARSAVLDIYMDEKIENYIVDIVFATRQPANYNLPQLEYHIEYGASPRASIFLTLTSKAHAFLQHRGYVIPEDIHAVGMDVLRHRIIVTYEAEAENVSSEDVVRQIFNKIEVP